jgi:hypothetical protein
MGDRTTNKMARTRTYTLVDASVFVLAAIVAGAEVRHRVAGLPLLIAHIDRTNSGAFWELTWIVDYLCRAFLYQILIAATIATLLLRLLSPRPSARRLFRQPGTVALTAALTGIGLALLVRAGPTLRHWRHYYETQLAFDETLTYLWSCCGRLAGVCVASSWITLALSGRFRPEQSWLDRMGRAIGVLWICGLAVWVASTCAGFRYYD